MGFMMENSREKGDTNCGTKKQYICELETQNKPPRGHDIDSYKPTSGGWCPAGTFHFGKNCYWIFAAADRTDFEIPEYRQNFGKF